MKKSRVVAILLLALFCVLIMSAVLIGKKNYSKKAISNPEVSKNTVVQTNQENISVGNFLDNPGFESTASAWYSPPTWKTNFVFDSNVVKSGTLSALLQLDSRQVGSQSTRVYGVSQDLSPTTFPNFISANYFVANWQKATKNQYLQMVVVVFGPDNAAEDIKSIGNYQIRYILSDIKEPPAQIRNAKYVILSDQKPVIGKWVFVERNLAQDFTQLWGGVPKSYKSIRVFFEARWDGRTETTPVLGKVYFDDLFLGNK